MMITHESMKISRAIYEYLNDYAPVEKTTSEHTLKSYKMSISLYVLFLQSRKNITPSKLSIHCFCNSFIEEWLSWLANERGNSPATCNIRLSGLREFLKYLSKKDVGFIVLEEATKVKFRKTPKRKVNGMTRDAVKALMNTPDTSTKCGKRDLTLMVVLYATAARINELLDLKISQLHLNDAKPHIEVIGKGHKMRILYLLPKAVTHLNSYLKDFHGENPSPNAYVFYSRNTGPYGKMSQAAVAKMLKKTAAIAHEKCNDVPLNLHAHQFRHAKASHWLEDNMNIAQISFLLGHENIQTTMIYMDITTEAQLKALATMEDESSSSLPKKWKKNSNTLMSFCGL